MATTKLFTAEDLATLGDDGFRYELIRGELRRLSPSGQWESAIAARFVRFLGAFVDERGLGLVTGADGGYFIERDPETIFAPDAAFVARERQVPPTTSIGFAPVPPDLVVEVLSPSDRAPEILHKVTRYLDAGVRLIWVVDPNRRTVTIYSPDALPRIIGEADDLDGGDVLPGFRLSVAEIFR